MVRKDALEVELRSELKVAHARIQVLENERLSFVGEKADVDYCTQLKADVDRLNTELNDVSHKLSKLKDKEMLTDKKYQLKCLEIEEQDEAQEEIAELKNTVSNLEDKIKNLKKDKEENEALITKL